MTNVNIGLVKNRNKPKTFILFSKNGKQKIHIKIIEIIFIFLIMKLVHISTHSKG